MMLLTAIHTIKPSYIWDWLRLTGQLVTQFQNFPLQKGALLIIIYCSFRHLGQYEASVTCLSEIFRDVYHAHMNPVELTEFLKECSAISLLYDGLSDYDLR